MESITTRNVFRMNGRQIRTATPVHTVNVPVRRALSATTQEVSVSVY